VAFLSCRRFSVSVTGSALRLGRGFGWWKPTFGEASWRSGMAHETHCKFRGSWRWPGVGSTGIWFRGWKVEGDLAPIGGTCVRVVVVYFFGGALVLGWLAGKWLRVSVNVARTGFLRPILCVGFPIEVMSQM